MTKASLALAVPPDDDPLATVLTALEKLGAVTKEGRSWRALCPIHGGRSLIVSAGAKHPVLLSCMGGECTVADILHELGLPWARIMGPTASTARDSGERVHPLPEATTLDRWHSKLMRNELFLRPLLDRGLTKATLREYEIGWDGRRYTIPIYDDDYNLTGIRLYHPKKDPKIKWARGSRTTLYLLDEATRNEGRVLICEGEWDAMLARQHGLLAITATAGAGTWRDDWSRRLAGMDVTICYDCDAAGRSGARKVADALRRIARSVRIVDLDPTRHDGYDVGDYLLDHTGEDLQDLALTIPPEPSAPSRLVDGYTFLFGEPDEIPSVWGVGENVLWAAGEGLMITGPQGVGKSTLVQQLLLARIGIGPRDLLGFPVTASDGNVLYLAMDRPRQVKRSMLRMATPDDREALTDSLVVYRGPLPFDITRDRAALANFVEEQGATTLVIDSMKDLVPGLAQDEVGAAVNLAFQEVLARGVEVAALHHHRKATGDNKRPRTLDDVFGSTWLTAGMGSVICLWGTAGATAIELDHLKQPLANVGPLRILHDHALGESSRGDVDVDLLQQVAALGSLTLEQAASLLYGRAEHPEKERARRQLERLTNEGCLRYEPGTKGGRGGGGTPPRWYEVED